MKTPSFFTADLVSRLRMLRNKKGLRELEEIACKIESSIKFSLPECGLCISDDSLYQGMTIMQAYRDHGQGQRLPYDNVVLEFYVPQMAYEGANGTRFVVNAWNDKSRDLIQVNCCYDTGREDIGWRLWETLIAICPNEYKVHYMRPDGYDLQATGDLEFGVIINNFIVNAVVQFLLFLATSAGVIEDYKSSEKILKKRARKNKSKQFHSYKVLKLTELKGSSDGSSLTAGTSPRVHLRRGHNRRLKDRVVWVSPSVVGDKSKGMVSKDYQVCRNTEGEL